MDMQLTFEDVASALSLDYECVFFVDNETNQYAMFAFRGKHTKLELTDTRDFWADTKVNMEAVVYPEDKLGFHALVIDDGDGGIGGRLENIAYGFAFKQGAYAHEISGMDLENDLVVRFGVECDKLTFVQKDDFLVFVLW